MIFFAFIFFFLIFSYFFFLKNNFFFYFIFFRHGAPQPDFDGRIHAPSATVSGMS